ncbi:NTP transferase domain-containing protein [Paenibacillus sp.]|uniref:nucleotidyltransferase family protein n=1 Tax=Paenibacillus sp. TaxID=58172 RepID=UPI0035682D24
MGAIGAVILAAGMSRRMGQPKLLLPFLGKPLFRYSVDAAIQAGLQPVVIVGGSRMEELLRHVADCADIEGIENQDYQSGMASSLQAGLQAVKGRADAAIVFLADQPLVAPVVINEIVRHYNLHRHEGIRIVRPEYQGRPGHPVLFDADLFAELEHIRGDEGGKSILIKHRSLLHVVPFANEQWGMDIDTPDDLRQLEKIAYAAGGEDGPK